MKHLFTIILIGLSFISCKKKEFKAYEGTYSGTESFYYSPSCGTDTTTFDQYAQTLDVALVKKSIEASRSVVNGGLPEQSTYVVEIDSFSQGSAKIFDDQNQYYGSYLELIFMGDSLYATRVFNIMCDLKTWSFVGVK